MAGIFEIEPIVGDFRRMGTAHAEIEEHYYGGKWFEERRDSAKQELLSLVRWAGLHKSGNSPGNSDRVPVLERLQAGKYAIVHVCAGGGGVTAAMDDLGWIARARDFICVDNDVKAENSHIQAGLGVEFARMNMHDFLDRLRAQPEVDYLFMGLNVPGWVVKHVGNKLLDMPGSVGLLTMLQQDSMYGPPISDDVGIVNRWLDSGEYTSGGGKEATRGEFTWGRANRYSCMLWKERN